MMIETGEISPEAEQFVKGCEDAIRQYKEMKVHYVQEAQRRFSKEPFISLPTNKDYWSGFRHGLFELINSRRVDV